MNSSSSHYVRIFDTSLRDGEQAPGASMNTSEKLEVARGLARLGVDVIEAGFPAASPDDLAAVQAIAAEIGQTPIAGRPQPEPPRSSAASPAAPATTSRPPGRASRAPSIRASILSSRRATCTCSTSSACRARR
ncbi:MAG: hypothetical protein WDM96_09130 [Lacunisphaera sp.]